MRVFGRDAAGKARLMLRRACLETPRKGPMRRASAPPRAEAQSSGNSLNPPNRDAAPQASRRSANPTGGGKRWRRCEIADIRAGYGRIDVNDQFVTLTTPDAEFTGELLESFYSPAVYGRLLLALGLFTRTVAFILAGNMAVAYFMAHAPRGFFPLLNGGELAIVYWFIFVYLSIAGGGEWTLDRWRAPASALSPSRA
jgi:hypothetical protein